MSVHIPQQQLMLIRGLPGSGKTTLAKRIIYGKGTWKHIETDLYWGDDYRFDITKIKQAHEWCQKHTKMHLNFGYNVIVSNTFTQRWELEPYLDIAKEYNIKPQIIIATGDFGSVHGVPQDVIQKMKDRFEWNIQLDV